MEGGSAMAGRVQWGYEAANGKFRLSCLYLHKGFALLWFWFAPASIALALKTRASDRLDWMYAGSLASKEDAAKKQDEALLGQRPAQLPDTAEPGAKVGTKPGDRVGTVVLVVHKFGRGLFSKLEDARI
eukprot:1161332-Pelagomonas_calceolata.AAC.5